MTRRSASSPSARRITTCCTRSAGLVCAAHPWLAIYKVALAWPIETEGLRRFAAGKRALLVVEEKRSFVERQIRDALYNLPADARPPVLGKQDASGATLIPATGELSPEIVAPALVRWLRATGMAVADAPVPARVAAPRGCWRARPPSAPAVRTTPRRSFPTAASHSPASAATSWRSSTATPAASARWAARA